MGPGRGYVLVSEIARQFYCEYSLHLSLNDSVPETPSMELGGIIHDEVFGDIRVGGGELMGIVRSRPLVIATLTLALDINDVKVVGVPDAVVFMNGVARFVVELKTSNRWLDTLFRHEYVQAQLYAYLVDRLGLGREPLVVIVKAPRDLDLVGKLRVLIRRELLSKYLGNTSLLPVKLRLRHAVIHVLPFDRSVEVDLRWALDYWLGNREPTASPSPGKCVSCPFRSRCPFRV
ncbi:PD-(D/E)XK nuclease family protein [Vulcanisaeta thermophila]|uniref:PD-(D/E)XK nuclease family protein n=1 Tax=Vulcanisaeta thermophila TaxID=867917 RepID=UPI001EE177F9|nr:PD-(D/E)XK nuclease family protein [Vulcanisaeta thermophila]